MPNFTVIPEFTVSPVSADTPVKFNNHTSNIIYSNTEIYRNQPITTLITKSPENNQLHLLIYNSNTCMYYEPLFNAIYAQQFFALFSPSTFSLNSFMAFLKYTIINYYTYLIVQTSSKNKNTFFRNIYPCPNYYNIFQYCRIHSPVYYTHPLQLLQDGLEACDNNITLLYPLLTASLDKFNQQ